MSLEFVVPRFVNTTERTLSRYLPDLILANIATDFGWFKDDGRVLVERVSNGGFVLGVVLNPLL